MEYYEKIRDENRKIYITRNKPQKFPSHFHSSLEIFVIKNGAYTITINKTQYPIKNGQLIIIDNYNVHSYSNWANGGKDCDDLSIIIPYDFTPSFNEKRKNKIIGNPVITDKELCDQIISVYDNFCINHNDYTTLCAVNLILSLLYDKIDWREKVNTTDANLIRQILTYIHNNYRNKISRSSIAKELGYTDAHISRTFHKFVGKGISEYINNLRILYIENARNNGDERTLLELIYDSGFSSQQTYYRCKKSLIHSDE